MFTHQSTTPTPNLTRMENPLTFAVSATDPAEQHVHDAYGRLAADDPHLVAFDILWLHSRCTRSSFARSPTTSRNPPRPNTVP